MLAEIAAAAAISGLAVLGLHLYWRLRWGPPASGSIPILAYHKVDSRFELGGTRVTPRQFGRQMVYLKQRGYTAVTLSQAVELMDQGRTAEKQYVCITFDDAYQGLYDHALPVLRRHGFAATAFVITDYVGQENRWDINWAGLRFAHLGWEQMREMQAAGIEFGSHSRSHRDLRFLEDRELRQELAGSKQDLERELGTAVTAFSYPFGRYDRRVREAVREAGYACACSLSPQTRNSELDRYALRRCGVYITDLLWDFRHKVDQQSPWFWTQDLWSRTVNFCAGGTAIAKRILGK